MNKIEALENELVELAGPLGKFVVKKQMRELSFSPKDVSGPMFQMLIEQCVANAIFDPKKQEEALKELKKKLLS